MGGGPGAEKERRKDLGWISWLRNLTWDRAAWLQRESDSTELLPNIIPVSRVTYRSEFLWIWMSLDAASTSGMGHSFQWVLIVCIWKWGEVEFAPFFSRSSKTSTHSWVASSSLDIGEAACKRHYYFWQLKSFLQCFSADRRLITSCSKIPGFLSQTRGLTQAAIAETSCRHWTRSTFHIFWLSCFLHDWTLGKLRRKFCSSYHSSVVRDVLAVADCGRIASRMAQGPEGEVWIGRQEQH